jgi:MFS family permease
MLVDYRSTNYRWYVLALCTASATLVVAMPYSCMPVLFKEISEDLGLNLVQIGTVWGASSLAGVFVSLVSGLLGDRFGMRLMLCVSCILAGITGALRGLSTDFLTLTLTVLIYGTARTILPIILTKLIAMWFKEKNFALANGIGAMGMGLGLMLGPMISATILSPLLGGWRNVLFLYGVVSVAIGILWLLFGREPKKVDSAIGYINPMPIHLGLSKLIRIKALWIIGLTMMFRSGCITGMIGYLPLYLRERGMAAASSDNALAIFFAASTISVVPLSSLSDRLGSRKVILFPAILVTTVCVGVLPLAQGITVWLLMILAGGFFDGFMAVICTMLLETEGVGLAYSGTALGLVFTISQIAGVVTPPLGNSLGNVNPGLPFVFWASISAVSLVTLAFSKETGRRTKRTLKVGD